MIIFLVATILVGPTLIAAGDALQTFKALSFGRTTSDYVQFKPTDMSPFVSSLTICMWVKRMHNASYPMVLHYNPNSNEIIMGDNGYYNGVKRDLDLRGKFPEAKVWFHHCLSWAAGGVHKVYINGEEIGSIPAVSSNLRLGGDMAIGNAAHSSKSSIHTFGGQLYKLNMYSEQLSSSQIKDMFQEGMCSAVEEKYESRELKWEDLLTKPRFGNVTEFTPTECITSSTSLQFRLNQTENKLKMTKNELLDTKTELNSTKNNLQEVSKTLNGTLSKLNSTEQKLQDVSTTLNGTLSELQETKTELSETQNELEEKDTKLLQTENELNSTQHNLREVSKTLNHTRSLLEAAKGLENVSRWGFLLTPSFLNRIFTRQLHDQLKNSWDILENFIGVNVTRGFVEHFGSRTC